MSIVIKAITRFSQSKINQDELSLCFQLATDNELLFGTSYDTLLSLIISFDCCNHQKLIIINQLLNEADRRDQLIFLLTTTNYDGSTPYYQALREGFIEISTHLAEKIALFVQSGDISKNHYQAMHLLKNNQGDFLLHDVAKQGDVMRFTAGFEEIERAYRKKWISLTDLQDLIMTPNPSGKRLLDTAIQFPRIARSIIKYIILNPVAPDENDDETTILFSENNKEETLLHRLAYNGDTVALNERFLEINRSIEAGRLSAQIYSSIFLKLIYTNFDACNLLRIGFRHSSGEVNQVTLYHARMANAKGWFDSTLYACFLLLHPKDNRSHEQSNNDSGFSYLHESLRSSHYRNAYAYIGACLQAILDDQISFDSFMMNLKQKNHHGYSVFHQAVNSQFLETAELILNLFSVLLPQDEYWQNAFTKNGAPRSPKCRNDKPHYVEINELLSQEKNRLIQDIPSTQKYIFYTTQFRTPSHEFLELIALIHQVKNHVKCAKQTDRLAKNTPHIYNSARNYTPCHFVPHSPDVHKPVDGSIRFQPSL